MSNSVQEWLDKTSVYEREGIGYPIGKKRKQESIDKQFATRKANSKTMSSEAREKIRQKALARWQDPEFVKNSHKGRKMSKSECKMRGISAQKRWDNTNPADRKKSVVNVKLFLTPYGKMTLKEAMKVSGLTEQQIRGRTARQTGGWGSTTEYVKREVL